MTLASFRFLHLPFSNSRSESYPTLSSFKSAWYLMLPFPLSNLYSSSHSDFLYLPSGLFTCSSSLFSKTYLCSKSYVSPHFTVFNKANSTFELLGQTASEHFLLSLLLVSSTELEVQANCETLIFRLLCCFIAFIIPLSV